MLTTQRHDRRVRRQAGLLLESLDDRLLLSWGARARWPRLWCIINRPSTRTATTHISPREVLGDRSPAALPANVSAALRSLYREYEDQVRDSRSTPSQPGDALLSIRDFRVAVRIKVAFPPALDAYLRDLRADGLQIVRTVPADGLAEGTAAGRQVAGRSAARGARVARVPAYQKVNPSRHASDQTHGAAFR